MARRYLRTVNLERSTADESTGVIADFTGGVQELIGHHFGSGAWSITEEPEGELLRWWVENGTFRGSLELKRGVDVSAVPGQGMIRKTTLRIAAQSAHAKRKEARQTEYAIWRRTAVIGTAIGASLLGGGLFVVEVAFAHRVHIRPVLLAAVVGGFIGGVIGELFGRGVGGMVRKRMSETNTAEDQRFEDVMAQWEQFIEALAETVDGFAGQVEETPSQTTMM